jgi:hypothetical protein
MPGGLRRSLSQSRATANRTQAGAFELRSETVVQRSRRKSFHPLRLREANSQRDAEVGLAFEVFEDFADNDLDEGHFIEVSFSNSPSRRLRSSLPSDWSYGVGGCALCRGGPGRNARCRWSVAAIQLRTLPGGGLLPCRCAFRQPHPQDFVGARLPAITRRTKPFEHVRRQADRDGNLLRDELRPRLRDASTTLSRAGSLENGTAFAKSALLHTRLSSSSSTRFLLLQSCLLIRFHLERFCMQSGDGPSIESSLS